MGLTRKRQESDISRFFFRTISAILQNNNKRRTLTKILGAWYAKSLFCHVADRAGGFLYLR